MIPLDPAPNLTEQVYARILEAITDRTLLPGQRIRQNELAEKLGVSRQPVSHALHLLHRQGLSPKAAAAVSRSPSSIPSASASSTKCAAPSTRWRRGLPPNGSRQMRPDAPRSRPRCTPAARIDRTTPLAQLIALDVDFHSAIYRLAGNPAIEEMIAPQWPHMRRSMATVLAELDYRESAWSEHEAIAARSWRATPRRPKRGAGACADRGTADGRTTEGNRQGGVTSAVDQSKQGGMHHETHTAADRAFQSRRLAVPARAVQPGGSRLPRAGSRQHL